MSAISVRRRTASTPAAPASASTSAAAPAAQASARCCCCWCCCASRPVLAARQTSADKNTTFCEGPPCRNLQVWGRPTQPLGARLGIRPDRLPAVWQVLRSLRGDLGSTPAKVWTVAQPGGAGEHAERPTRTSLNEAAPCALPHPPPHSMRQVVRLCPTLRHTRSRCLHHPTLLLAPPYP
eukprot:361142-Chlamydomonas_euryale.AAC.1